MHAEGLCTDVVKFSWHEGFHRQKILKFLDIYSGDPTHFPSNEDEHWEEDLTTQFKLTKEDMDSIVQEWREKWKPPIEYYQIFVEDDPR